MQVQYLQQMAARQVILQSVQGKVNAWAVGADLTCTDEVRKVAALSQAPLVQTQHVGNGHGCVAAPHIHLPTFSIQAKS